jgi:hypothetical protein
MSWWSEVLFFHGICRACPSQPEYTKIHKKHEAKKKNQASRYKGKQGDWCAASRNALAAAVADDW